MDEKDDTTTNSSQSGEDTDISETCDTCGAPIDTEEWHPTTTEWDEDGELTIYTFCSQDCREAWEDS